MRCASARTLKLELTFDVLTALKDGFSAVMNNKKALENSRAFSRMRNLELIDKAYVRIHDVGVQSANIVQVVELRSHFQV